VQLEQSTKVRIEESDAQMFRTVGDIYAFLSSRP
jgi:hypothetical protein